MIRTALISLLLASPAAAQAPIGFEQVWQVFTTQCPPALRDPQSFIDALPKPGPAGERVMTTSPDGRFIMVDTSIDGVQISLDMSVTGDVISRGCSFIAYGHNGLDPTVSPATMHDMLTAKFGEQPQAHLAGGLMPREIPTGMPAPTPAVSVNQNMYEYHFTGLFEDLDTVGSASFGPGFLSFHVQVIAVKNE
ncbi:MAG: hypothetical protein AAGA12_03225 [Pseudomonadota bacterium]